MGRRTRTGIALSCLIPLRASWARPIWQNATLVKGIRPDLYRVGIAHELAWDPEGKQIGNGSNHLKT